MIVLLTVVHILICFFLVIVVLLQSGKAADLAGAFGGMGSQTAFGPRGSATILSKATTIAAGLFMVTSLTLAILSTRGAGVGSSVLERQPAKPAQTAPMPGGARQTAPLPAGQPAPGPGQPSVSFGTEGGPQQAIPIQLNPPGQPQPAQPAAPASKPAAPAPKPAAPARK